MLLLAVNADDGLGAGDALERDRVHGSAEGEVEVRCDVALVAAIPLSSGNPRAWTPVGSRPGRSTCARYSARRRCGAIAMYCTSV